MNSAVIDLIRRVQAGEYTLFNDVYQMTYQDTIAPVMAMCSGRRDMAEPVVKEAYTRAYNRILTLKEPEQFQTWINQIAREVANEMYGQPAKGTTPTSAPVYKPKKKVPLVPIIIGAAVGGLLLIGVLIFILLRFVLLPNIGNKPSDTIDVVESVEEGANVSEDGLSWYMDGTTLVIRGNGPMTNYETAESTPWAKEGYQKTIEAVRIEEGVTSVGDMAFEYCEGIRSVSLPEGLTRIGKEAFWGDGKLEALYIPSSVRDIGENAFKFSGLTTIQGVSGSFAEEYAMFNGLAFANTSSEGETVANASPETEETAPKEESLPLGEQLEILNNFGAKLSEGQNLFHYVDFIYVKKDAYVSPVTVKTAGILSYIPVQVGNDENLLVFRLLPGEQMTEDISYSEIIFEVYGVESDGEVVLKHSAALLDPFYYDSYNAAIFYRQTEDKLCFGIEMNGDAYLYADGMGDSVRIFELKEDGFELVGDKSISGSYFDDGALSNYYSALNEIGIVNRVIDDVKNDLTVYEDTSWNILSTLEYQYDPMLLREMNEGHVKGHFYGYERDVHYDTKCKSGEIIKAGIFRTVSRVNFLQDQGNLTGIAADFAGTEWLGSDGTILVFKNDGRCIYREPGNNDKPYFRVGNYGTWRIDGDKLYIDITTSSAYTLYVDFSSGSDTWKLEKASGSGGWNPETFTKLTK